MYFAIAAIIAAVLLILKKEQWLDVRHGILWNQFSVFLFRYAAILFILALAGTIADDAVVVVPAGQRGVVYDILRKGVRPVPLGEGFNFITPFVQQITLMDVRVQKDTYDATAQSKDLQTVHAKVALNFHPIPSETPAIYRDFALGYSEK
ncbi:MAG: SPFH domain-containing protein, partial [Elusimicrobiota bacterium]